MFRFHLDFPPFPTTIALGGRLLADVTPPLEMLNDCHRRIEHYLDVLKRVVDQFGDGAWNEETTHALEQSLTQDSTPRNSARRSRIGCTRRRIASSRGGAACGSFGTSLRCQ